MNPPTRCEVHKHARGEKQGVDQIHHQLQNVALQWAKATLADPISPNWRWFTCLEITSKDWAQARRQKKESSKQHISTLVLTAWLPLHQILNKSFSWHSMNTAAKKRERERERKREREEKKNHTQTCTHPHTRTQTRTHRMPCSFDKAAAFSFVLQPSRD